MKGTKFHLDYPLLNVLHIRNLRKLPKEALCFLSVPFKTFTIAMAFDSAKLYAYLVESQTNVMPKED